MSRRFQHYHVFSMGQHRGHPRLWLEGRYLERAGFRAGCAYSVEVGPLRVVLRLVEAGDRTVSGKDSAAGRRPVIELNRASLLGELAGFDRVRVVVCDAEIHVMPLASEVKRRRRLQRTAARLREGSALQIGSLSHGGGVLSHALHQGLGDAGVAATLAFANEVRADLCMHAASVNDCWHDETVGLVAPMQELAIDTWAMARLPECDVLEAGIPCSGASIAGRSKRGLVHPEAHPEVGHLVVPALALIAQCNPLLVLIENVVPYQSSASADILRNALRDLGYDVHEAVVDSAKFNALEQRKRFVLVAVTSGVEFDLAELEQRHPAPQRLRLGDVLEAPELVADRWSEMAGLKRKEVRDKAEGKGFAMQVFGAESNRICTITKGYAKRRSTDAKIQNPDRPELLRQITAIEHARVKQVPERLIEGLSETIAHELLGQSVVYEPFRAIGRLIGDALGRWRQKLDGLADGAAITPWIAQRKISA